MQCSAYLVADDERYIAVLDALLSVSLIWRAVTSLSAMLALNFSVFRILTVLMLVAHALSYFSNSYVVFESISVRFLAQSAFVVAVLHSACAR